MHELVRDEGLCLYSLGRFGEAADTLGSYLAASPEADDALMVYTLLSRLREQQGGDDGGSGGDSSAGDASGAG